jgi:hypothetical protein
MQRILNITTDNGSDAAAAVKQFFQLVNGFVGTEQFTPRLLYALEFITCYVF